MAMPGSVISLFPLSNGMILMGTIENCFFEVFISDFRFFPFKDFAHFHLSFSNWPLLVMSVT
jgi:hypothetical protein